MTKEEKTNEEEIILGLLKDDVESFGWKEDNFEECRACGRRTMYRVRIYDIIDLKYDIAYTLTMIPLCPKCQKKLQEKGVI